MDPVTPEKLSSAFPTTVPAAGDVSALARPFPAETSICPLVTGPVTLHSALPNKAIFTVVSPTNDGLTSYIGETAITPATNGS